MKFISFLIILLTLSGCAHKSQFKVAEADKGRHIFQYCGGHEWGFSQKLGSDIKGPYLFVFLESEFRPDADLVMANVVVHSKTDADFKIKAQDLKMLRDGKPVSEAQPNFWVIRDVPQIHDLYPESDYNAKPTGENQWEVAKIKYGGFFGRSSTEEPFTVKLERLPNEEIKTESVHVPLDPKTARSVFFTRKTVIAFDDKRPAAAQITIQVPAFEINGISVPADTFTLNYDRSRLENGLQNLTNRCLSLVEISEAERNKDSWVWFMYPRIRD